MDKAAACSSPPAEQVSVCQVQPPSDGQRCHTGEHLARMALIACVGSAKMDRNTEEARCGEHYISRHKQGKTVLLQLAIPKSTNWPMPRAPAHQPTRRAAKAAIKVFAGRHVGGGGGDVNCIQPVQQPEGAQRTV